MLALYSVECYSNAVLDYGDEGGDDGMSVANYFLNFTRRCVDIVMARLYSTAT
jgi:hypothetical protein